MSLPPVLSRQEWVAARKSLLTKEKAFTRQRDALNIERRLLDTFEGHRQLILVHFMFDPSWDDGCSSCTAGADEVSDGFLRHLHARDTSYATVSRAPLAKIENYKERRGWTFPWYSSYGSDFNYDFHVSLDESVAPIEYNYRTKAELAAATGASPGRGDNGSARS